MHKKNGEKYELNDSGKLILSDSRHKLINERKNMLDELYGCEVIFESDHFVGVWNLTDETHQLFHKGNGKEYAMSRVGIESIIRYALNVELGVWGIDV